MTVLKIVTLSEDSYIKSRAKRTEQIDSVMQATVGMYGDLQGIAGKSLQEIEGLDFLALDSPAKKTKRSF